MVASMKNKACRITNTTPAATFGALLQFVSSKLEWGVPDGGISLSDVLAGSVVWRDYVACLREDVGAPSRTCESAGASGAIPTEARVGSEGRGAGRPRKTAT